MQIAEIRQQWEEFTQKYKTLLMTNDDKWQHKLYTLQSYVEEHNMLPTYNDKNKEIKTLADWMSHQRTNYKTKQRIMQSSEIRQEWEEFATKYLQLFN
jgi:hypothetical protein